MFTDDCCVLNFLGTGRALLHGTSCGAITDLNGGTRGVYPLLHSPSLRWRNYAVREEMVRTPKTAPKFHPFAEFEQLVAAGSDVLGKVGIFLGGEAGLRLGEMTALEWLDLEYAAGHAQHRQACGASSWCEAP